MTNYQCNPRKTSMKYYCRLPWACLRLLQKPRHKWSKRWKWSKLNNLANDWFFHLSRNLTSTLPASSMNPSPSFSAHLSSSKPAIMAAAPSNIPAAQSSLNLNSNFLSGLGSMTNTAKVVPMNQMKMLSTNTQPSFLSAQSSQFQNSANSLSTLSPIVTNQINPAKRNGKESTIALSAQEINDFLS